MSLIISLNDKIITLKGTLNTGNLNSFKNHIGFILNAHNEITLHIDKDTKIDTSGMFALKAVYKKAVLNNTIFFVSGYRSEEVYEDFQIINIA